MNILLTGGTGYLGSHLARALVAAGHRVAVLMRRSSDRQRLDDIRAELAWYDLERGGMADAFSDMRFDAVVHTATCYGRGGESAGAVFAANTVWPLQLLEMAISAGVPLFINTDTSLDRSLNPYALSKKQFRDWGYRLADEKKIGFHNILLEHFYGPGDLESKFITQVIRRCLRCEPELMLTSGTQRRDFIFIDDVVTAYLLILQRADAENGPGFREYGLGSGTAVAIREAVVLIRELTGSVTALNFGAVPLRNNEVMVSQADIGALRALGWQPRVSLADGLKHTIGLERKLLERT